MKNRLSSRQICCIANKFFSLIVVIFVLAGQLLYFEQGALIKSVNKNKPQSSSLVTNSSELKGDEIIYQLKVVTNSFENYSSEKNILHAIHFSLDNHRKLFSTQFFSNPNRQLILTTFFNTQTDPRSPPLA